MPLIRLATGADAAVVADVYLRARRAAGGIPPLVHSDDEVRRWIADLVVPGGDTWVSGGDGHAAAMMVLAGNWIEHLYVAPEVWRSGLGGTLMRHAQGRRDELNLWTFAANQPARAFYEAHGFSADGTASSDNEEGAPAVRYRWQVGG